MPSIGGKCRKLWKLTAVTIVARNRNIIITAPRFMATSSVLALGEALGTAACINVAGTT